MINTMRVSFDFDDTLDRPDVQHFAEQLRELPIGGRADRMGFQLRRGLLTIIAQSYILSIGVIASP